MPPVARTQTPASPRLPPGKPSPKSMPQGLIPGDQILFKRGEVWREQLTVPSSGSSGNPITIGAYGSGALPVINGANLLSSGWTQFSSTVWQASVTTRPNQVFFNGVRGTPVASVAAINAASKWYWASNILYVYSTSNPATAFTNPGIEASQRELKYFWKWKKLCNNSEFEFTKLKWLWDRFCWRGSI